MKENSKNILVIIGFILSIIAFALSIFSFYGIFIFTDIFGISYTLSTSISPIISILSIIISCFGIKKAKGIGVSFASAAIILSIVCILFGIYIFVANTITTPQ